MRDVRAHWQAVPPAPNEKFAAAFGLGDTQFSYRMNGIMIQNFGDTGGHSTALKDYDYSELTKWFFVQDSLDPHSEFIPYLAGYYFSALQEPEKFRPVLDYLKKVGLRPEGEKWRWLAQAAWIARFKMEDFDTALLLAQLLENTQNPNLPPWAGHMSVFILNAKGEKESAYALMVEILKSTVNKLHPNEVNAMRDYLCKQILDRDEARNDPLCQVKY